MTTFLIIYCTVCYCFALFLVFFVPGKTTPRDYARLVFAPVTIPLAIVATIYELYFKGIDLE